MCLKYNRNMILYSLLKNIKPLIIQWNRYTQQQRNRTQIIFLISYNSKVYVGMSISYKGGEGKKSTSKIIIKILMASCTSNRLVLSTLFQNYFYIVGLNLTWFLKKGYGYPKSLGYRNVWALNWLKI